MKTKGKHAWLITWEGPDSEYNGRCKVVAVLPPQHGERSIVSLLTVLHCSEYNFTLCEKMGFCSPNRTDPFLLKPYRNINLEFWYGHIPNEFLSARKIKNLRCEESKTDCFETTLYWTELPKFIPNPKYGPEGPPVGKRHDALKEVSGHREEHYTYSIRPAIEEKKARKQKQRE